MLSRIRSFGLNGLDGFAVTVEVDVAGGLPYYETVGLPDAAVRESKERVRAAIKNSGFTYPIGRITINLAPADLRKEGSVYDLPIAIGILAASAQVPSDAAAGHVFLGELALDGEIRAVAGILPMTIGAYGGGERSLILPSKNAAEACYIAGIDVRAAHDLKQIAGYLKTGEGLAPVEPRSWNGASAAYPMDFSDIRGQQGAKRAAEVAVAGGHNMLLIGTPGSGKTMLARSIPSILPELTSDEALAITKIHSITGATLGLDGLVAQRPFRAPHHSASAVSIIGGGRGALPGEISLAHYGVLFLDELPEFRKDLLEALRQPIEDGYVTITRALARCVYPSRFMLVAAMNPCPCGQYGSRINPCRCSAHEIMRYRNRISGPLLDRIDLHVEMTEVGYADIRERGACEGSSAIRARVNAARQLQAERYKDEGILTNAELTGRLIEKHCSIDSRAEGLLRGAFDRLKLSARAYTRILKVARTIADLSGGGDITTGHIAEAIQYRSADSKYWEEA